MTASIGHQKIHRQEETPQPLWRALIVNRCSQDFGAMQIARIIE